MIQREIRHDPGTFPACAACGREPKHVQAVGSHSGESFDVRHPTGERHRLECRCGEHTPWLSHLVVAESHWRTHYAEAEAPKPRRTVLRLHKKEA